MNRGKIISQMDELFVTKDDYKEIKEKDRKMYQDHAGVLGIIPKTATAKEMIETNFDVKAGKIPNIDFKINKKDVGTEIVCKYSIHYLIKLLEFIKLLGDEVSPKIRIKKDTPMSIETEQFIFFLAPRIDSEV